MKLRFLFGCALVSAVAGFGATVEVASPDGRVRLTLSTDAAGHLQYAVESDRQVRLHPAPAGVTVDGLDLGARAVPGPVVRREIDEQFPWRGN